MSKADSANTTSPPPGARPAATVSPTGADPIFAAIERHRIADQEYGDVLTRRGALENDLPRHLRRSDIDRSGEHIVETDDPRWIAAERSAWEGGEKSLECDRALVETRPTTIEGVRALLRYTADFIGDDYDTSNGVLENAAKALEALTPGLPVVEEADESLRFGKACHEWFEARAAEAKINAGGTAGAADPDAAIDAVLERLQAAEHQLTCLPAILPHQLVDKFEILETMISKRERDGRPADNRHMLMLSSMKADLYCFQIERREGGE